MIIKTNNLILPIKISLFIFCHIAYSYSFIPKNHEWTTWPSYCQARYIETTVGASSEYRKKIPLVVRLTKWREIFGDSFIHIHHYCAGIIWIARSRSEDARTRDQSLHAAIAEITYTYDRVPPESPIYSEVSAYLAQAFFGLGDTEKALEILKIAISRKPDKTPAYIMMAEIFIKSKKYQDALDILLKAQNVTTTESSELNYFLGYVYLKLDKFEEASKYGKRAYQLGYPLPGLKKMLQSKNLWK